VLCGDTVVIDARSRRRRWQTQLTLSNVTAPVLGDAESTDEVSWCSVYHVDLYDSHGQSYGEACNTVVQF